MNLRDLEYVVALAEHQNFTRAAEAVAVSQPALSNQVKKLELELGVPIFHRDRNGVTMTAYGRELLENAKQILDLVGNIGELAQKYKAPDSRPLRIGMTPTLAAYLSRYFRDLFRPIAGDRKIVIVEEYPVVLARMIEDRTIEMAFISRQWCDRINATSGSRLDFRSLWFEELFLGMRKEHPLALRDGIWAHEVPADQLIRFPISFGYSLEQDLPKPNEAAMESIGIDVKSARFETVCRYVAQSDTCTLVNAIAAEQFTRDGFGLAFIPFHDEGNIRELGVITRAQYSSPELLTALHQSICQAAPQGTKASFPGHPRPINIAVTP